MEKITSSESVATEEGRQYHIDLCPGELAEYILIEGDPGRVEKTAKFFDEITLKRKNREYFTITGKVNDIPISVMSTGIGPSATEIAVIEIAQITKNPTIIRVGSCGALQPEINVGELVISAKALRLENTSDFFAPKDFEAVSDRQVLDALTEAAEEMNYLYHVGLTATAPSFYGAQGREVPKFKPINPNLPEDLRKREVLNFEMETSTLFVLSKVGGLRAGSVCAVYANRAKGEVINPEQKETAERRCIEVGIEAVKLLNGEEVKCL